MIKHACLELEIKVSYVSNLVQETTLDQQLNLAVSSPRKTPDN